MKKLISITLLALALVCSAFAKSNPTTVTPEMIQRAAHAVPALQAMMKDPDSFVLEGVSIDALEDKKHPDEPTTCFFFRAHNSMGGYGDTGRAYLGRNGKIRVFDPSTGDEIAANIICGPKHNIDVTAQVKAALAPPTPPAETPEDKAKHAQQYADCPKVAVGNPSIVCKQ